MPSRVEEQAFSEIKRLVRFGRFDKKRKDRETGEDRNDPIATTPAEAAKYAQIRFRAALTVLEWAPKMAGDIDLKLEGFLRMSREEQDKAMDEAVASGSLTRQQANEMLAEIRTEGYGFEGQEETMGSGEDSGPEEAGDDDQGATG